MRDMKYTYRNFVGKAEREGPLGIVMCRWEDNVEINLKSVL
jgi:hypothetical protein